jgi:2,4-dienoyl-CoA reductase-like NADH-dependent reductase (Old Yellow Enzyme family)
MSRLFTPITFRDLTVRNRVFVSPMCQYSSVDGMPNGWHLVHLGSRAVGGAGLVMMEATAVSPEGRITPWDMGIWSDLHARAMREITTFIREQGGARAAILLAHAGRKASTARPWDGGHGLSDADGGWTPLAPSPVPFADDYRRPREMTVADIDVVVRDFGVAALRALDAGFECVEIHMAHGYLLHEFLSPITNHRNDEYGGSFENRTRLPMRVASQVREVWPKHLPVFVRLSCTDWITEGDSWDLPQSIEFARLLKDAGIDLIDCSSGGLVPNAKIDVHPGYQVPFSEAIRRDAGIATGAVGMITRPVHAEQIVASGQADCVLIARAMLRDPYWTLHAATELGADVEWPVQYARAKPRKWH